MPNSNTFDIPPIGNFVRTYLLRSAVSIDPFARNKRWATHTNDLNPDTKAEYHLDAEEFLQALVHRGVKADLVIFDPPYSPRQIADCYQSIGRTVTQQDTQSAALYSRVRHSIIPLLLPGGVVLSFGWNSVGMGLKHGFKTEEILLCCHGGAHNDTICIAERKIAIAPDFFTQSEPQIPGSIHEVNAVSVPRKESSSPALRSSLGGKEEEEKKIL